MGETCCRMRGVAECGGGVRGGGARAGCLGWRRRKAEGRRDAGRMAEVGGLRRRPEGSGKGCLSQTVGASKTTTLCSLSNIHLKLR